MNYELSIMNYKLYLDSCATTPVCDAAVEAVVSAMTKDYGNPSSLHNMGIAAEKILTLAREKIANALGACVKPNEIIFTSGATESNNIVLYGVAACHKRKGNKIITTAYEHSSILSPLDDLEKKGWEVVKINNNIEDNIIDAVDDNTVLVTFSTVNNETGTVINAEKVITAIRRNYPNVLIHLDAAQMFCKYPLNLSRLDINFLSASGHKFAAPKGTGFLYIKNKTRLTPLMRGGGQENGIRPGTQSVPLINGLAAAVQDSYPKMKERQEHYKILNLYLREKLSEIPQIKINSPYNGADNILNFSTNTVRSEIMLHYLEQHSIYISSGSACGKGKPSHVLTAMGFSPKEIDTALRASFLPTTNIDDLDFFVEKLKLGMETINR